METKMYTSYIYPSFISYIAEIKMQVNKGFVTEMKIPHKSSRKISSVDDLNFQHDYKNMTEYEDNMKLLIWILKILGALPIYKNKNGKWQFILRSWMFFYSISVYTSLMIISVISYNKYVSNYLHSHKEVTFYDYLDMIWCLTQKFPLILVPLILWTEANRISNYLHSWKMLQKHYNMTDLGINSSHLRRLSLIWVIAISGVEIAKESMEITIVKWGTTLDFITILHYISYFTPAVLNQYLVLFWCLSCKALASAGKKLRADFHQELQNSSTSAYIIKQFHLLWLELSRLCQELGRTFCYTYCFSIIYIFVLSISAVYFFIEEVQNPSGWGPMLAIDILVTFSEVFFLCSTAYKVQSIVGPEFQEYVLTMSLKIQNIEAKYEMKEFLQSIQTCPPEISLGGYCIVDRNLIVSLGAMMVTYLVIIVQFDLSAEKQH